MSTWFYLLTQKGEFYILNIINNLKDNKRKGEKSYGIL